ncbi:MAG: gliding motility protein GldM [Flavobacteriales bacterium]
MAGGKETPRQKMIGMMYLVLTALLAMNVSKDILDAFVIINDGIVVTNKNFMAKNQFTYNLFEKAKANDPGKVKEFYDKAFRAKGLADALYEHIEELKKYLIAHTGGYESIEAVPHDSLFELKNVDSKDNYDIPTHILIGSDPGNPIDGEHTAKELRGLIDEFKNDLLFLFDDEAERDALQLGLSTEDFGMKNGTFESWETGNFDHVPLAATVTALSKIQSDIRNAEADIIKALYRNISADDFKFDTLAAKVIPRSNYVIQGDSFVADVFVAAFSTTQDPRMRLASEFDKETGMPVYENFDQLDSSNIRIVNGMARYAIPASSEGLKEWGGVIQIKAPDGSWASYKVPMQTYTVAKPALVVSPTAMNVFYRGLENPVEVSVPGVPTEKLEISISNASKSGTNGNFKVKPGSGSECVVTVSAEINGKKQNFGKKEFRVKNVPDPKPYFGGKTGSENIPMRDLVAAPGVIAKMENFEFDLRFDIVSYQVSATIKGNVVEQACQGPQLTSNAKQIIGALKSGQKVYIEKIKAKGPDGTLRDLGTIALKVI